MAASLLILLCLLSHSAIWSLLSVQVLIDEVLLHFLLQKKSPLTIVCGEMTIDKTKLFMFRRMYAGKTDNSPNTDLSIMAEAVV